MLISCHQAIAEPRQPTLTVNKDSRWIFTSPKDFGQMEKFLQSNKKCYLGLFGWFIYDTKTHTMLSKADIHEKFPKLNDFMPLDCGFKSNDDELKKHLDIETPANPGLILVYFDFFDRDFLYNNAKPELISKQQKRLNTLSQITSIPKYLVLTPTNGIK